MKIFSKYIWLSNFIFIFGASAGEFSGNIENIQVGPDGHAVIKIVNAPTHSCGGALDWYSLGIKGQDIKTELMLSVALAAYMGGKSIHVWTTDHNCADGIEKIDYLRM